MGYAAHWSDRYIGRAFVEGEFDCGDLAVLVQHEVFGKAIALPSDHGDDAASRTAAIQAHIADLVEPLAPGETPRDGDPVLLRCRGADQHIGTYCVLGNEDWILHNQERIGVHRTRVSRLRLWGYTIEGFYRWR